MEGPKENKYQVIISGTAENNFYEVLEDLYDKYPLEKAEQIADDLRDMTKTLQQFPNRGAIEQRLNHRKKGYRYILFKRISRAQRSSII